VGPDVMREREELSRDGVVFVNLTLDQAKKRLCTEPEILTRGFMDSPNDADFLTGLRKKAGEAARGANGNLEKEVAQAAHTYIYSETRRSPVVMVSVSRV
jgi:ribonuclease J